MKRLVIVGTVLSSALLTAGTPALASTSHGTSVKPWCKASAAPANDGWPGDYNVYVKSNRPHKSATASDATDTWSDQKRTEKVPRPSISGTSRPARRSRSRSAGPPAGRRPSGA